MVVVQFPDLWGRNVSPFGLKLEAWLRLADIPYTVEPSTDLGKAPKGKLPYIRDEGRLIGDTTLIIEHLKSSRGIDPDAGLDERERAEALMLAAAVRGSLLLRPGLQPLDRRGWLVRRCTRPSSAACRSRSAGWPPATSAGGSGACCTCRASGRHRPAEIYAMARARPRRRWPTISATARS